MDPRWFDANWALEFLGDLIVVIAWFVAVILAVELVCVIELWLREGRVGKLAPPPRP